ncbi:putative major facilitator superfamily transporter [Microlunatus phosphovorus NM-1]|uniref:Putative major facilitator superfamily transporter n=1 Tax=Microlunatus phosphovorus (strain ATCC 700054 / DSM 10555 / JCM 9379 / NBRC 101784 / NCIMB 13414 / VKM Ac-1990 / NM-1) TaxID=1032480 RepID=F5XGF1_MICPN|nr:putative major facilitator superfamily transporter [Microlunatus phosphovorus NM-1]
MPTVDSVAPSIRRALGRSFSLFWFGEGVSLLGAATTSVLVPLLAVTQLSAGPGWMGLLTAATWLPWLVIGLPAGAWMDRSDPRRIMITADLVAAAALASVPVAWWLDALGLAQLLVVALVTGTCTVFFRTGYVKLLPQIVPAGALETANARVFGTESAMQVVGPGVAGLLAQVASAAVGLVGSVLGFCVSAICLARIRGETDQGARRKRCRLDRTDQRRNPYCARRPQPTSADGRRWGVQLRSHRVRSASRAVLGRRSGVDRSAGGGRDHDRWRRRSARGGGSSPARPALRHRPSIDRSAGHRWAECAPGRRAEQSGTARADRDRVGAGGGGGGGRQRDQGSLAATVRTFGADGSSAHHDAGGELRHHAAGRVGCRSPRQSLGRTAGNTAAGGHSCRRLPEHRWHQARPDADPAGPSGDSG